MNAIQNPKSKLQNRTLWLGLAFVSPWLLGFLIFTLYPILASFYYSFCEYRVLRPPQWVGIRNYVELFTDKEYFLCFAFQCCLQQ